MSSGPFDVWKSYLRFKLHFTGKMDYFKYDAPVKSLSLDAFVVRRDRQFFERIFNKYKGDSKRFLLSCFVGIKRYPSEMYVYDMLDDTYYEDQWLRFQKAESSLSRTFTDDLTKMIRKAGNLKDAIRPDSMPMLLKRCVNYDFNIESYVILNKIVPINTTYQKKFEIDPRIQKLCEIAASYDSFINIDLDQVKQIVRDVSEAESC